MYINSRVTTNTQTYLHSFIYQVVHDLVRDFPEMTIVLNGER